MPSLRSLSRLLPAVALVPLAGCISFGAKPPPTLMDLRADVSPATQPQTAAAGTSVTIATPGLPAASGGTRLPVRTSPTAVAYLRDAVWADNPARLFRTVLAETIAVRTGRVTLDPRQYALAPGARLGGTLAFFGYDAPSGQAVATYDATLVRGDGKPLETRRFEAKVAAGDQPQAVAAALNQASNRIAGEVADWIGR